MTEEMKALRAGRMVNIGGVLAKRCSGCWVTKKIEQFHDDASKASGMRSHCVVCMSRRKRHKD
ncbi:hypothetical protein K32_48410 [Kaistia sp. 32K]|uniref:hypothetical protein n=1 Tax=Kaistia sp. 32K TaxID=2795690 RepID=UPI00191569D1|nr:hypothetical protein [Kaistia sp. 32K]BCP56224.1 hypothetical protein K32_48410 [Kaistia sp. 32K]